MKAIISFKKYFTLCLATAIGLFVNSQPGKNLVLAEKYYAAGEYFTAAGLYEQYLNPTVKQRSFTDFPLNNKKSGGNSVINMSKSDVQYKQAECYRLSNYWKEAATLYNTVFELDPTKYASALYWHAVSQRSMGDFAAAEESIAKFLNDHASQTSLQQDAVHEKQTLSFIRSQLAKPDILLYHVQKLNAPDIADKGFFGFSASTDNNILFASAQKDGNTLEGLTPYHNRLFSAQLMGGGLSKIEPLSIKGLDSLLNQGGATMSTDGKHLYFTQWKNINGKQVASIFYSKKETTDWSNPVELITDNFNYKQPFYKNGNLYFSSDREGSKGGFDIWYASVDGDGRIGKPVNINAINTQADEVAPFYHNASGSLIFSSNGMIGMGGYDLFLSKTSGGSYSSPENMGYPINSSRDDLYFFAAENTPLLTNALFSSDRGSECCLSTYTLSKTPKTKMLSGLVYDCKNNEPLEGAEVVLKDAEGNTIKTTTAANGSYRFSLANEGANQQLFISKEKYNDTAATIAIEKINSNDWRTDTLINTILCIEKKFVLKVENVVTVYFDFDKSNLKERGVSQLDSIYNVLVENPTYTLQVSGYTDGLGSVEYNKKLSDKRARSCADYLISKGVDPARITFESFGACCPIEMELINGRDNPDGRSMNRRALINITKE